MARRKHRRQFARNAAEGGPPAGTPSPASQRQSLATGPSGRSASEGPDAPDRLNPWLLAGVCALWVARPLVVSESAAEEGDGLPLVMLWLALGVVWLLGWIGRQRFSFRFAWIDALVLVLVGLHVAAGVRGAVAGHPRPAVNMIWEWVALGLGFILTRQVLPRGPCVRAVAAVMVALAVGLSGYGVYQYAWELPATRAEYRRHPEKVLREAGLDLAADPAMRRKFEDRLNSPEPIATFALTNSLAGFLAPWLVVLIGLGTAGWPVQNGPTPAGLRVCQGGVALAAALVAGCLILTMSRSAYLAAALGLVLVAAGAVRSWRQRWRLVAGAAVVVAVLATAAVVTGGLDASVFTQAGRSLTVRLDYWRATMAMIADHLWLGVGPGNFQAEYTRYKLPAAAEEVAEPHNFVLEVWATAGTPAVIALAAVLGRFGWMVAKAIPRSTQEMGRVSPSALAASGTLPDWGPPLFAAVGGLVGYPVGLLAGWTASAPSSAAGVGLAMVLATGTLATLWPWTLRGRLPAWLPGLAVGVLAVNLLAAGAMGFPGVAGSLWLLVALGVSVAEETSVRPDGPDPSQGPAEPGSSQAGYLHLWPQPAAWALLAGGLAAVAACYATAYRPVLECRAAMAAARRQPDRTEPLLLRSAEADPLASRPWEMLAALRFQTWQGRPDPAAVQSFRQATQAMLQRAPKASALWLATGDRYLEIYRHTGQKAWLDEALRAYDQAAELYPANPVIHGRWALACEAAGDQAGFRQHAQDALRLHELADPAGQRLPDELRRLLERNESNRG